MALIGQVKLALRSMHSTIRRPCMMFGFSVHLYYSLLQCRCPSSGPRAFPLNYYENHTLRWEAAVLSTSVRFNLGLPVWHRVSPQGRTTALVVSIQQCVLIRIYRRISIYLILLRFSGEVDVASRQGGFTFNFVHIRQGLQASHWLNISRLTARFTFGGRV